MEQDKEAEPETKACPAQLEGGRTESEPRWKLGAQRTDPAAKLKPAVRKSNQIPPQGLLFHFPSLSIADTWQLPQNTITSA